MRILLLAALGNYCKHDTWGDEVCRSLEPSRARSLIFLDGGCDTGQLEHHGFTLFEWSIGLDNLPNR